MSIQNIISEFTQGNADGNQGNHASGALGNIGSMIPGGLAGGAAAGGLMALFMGSKSTRKMAKKVVQYGGTAVLGGLAYSAYSNWQKNKAIAQTQAVTDQDIERSGQTKFAPAEESSNLTDSEPLSLVLTKAMIAASKADNDFDANEQKNLFEAFENLGLTAEEKVNVFALMNRDISIQEIADQVSLEEHKAEVYLAAYLAIEVDNQLERAFLNDLALALNLPKGLPAYLEQQADQGVTY